MERKPYPTDLSNAQWRALAPLVPPAKPGGRPRSTDMREALNALISMARTGCSWRLIPHDLPHPSTLKNFFYRWQDDGTWARMNDTLRRQVRVAAGRDPEPSAAIIDSQPVKTTEEVSPEGLTLARRSAGASARYLSTRWG